MWFGGVRYHCVRAFRPSMSLQAKTQTHKILETVLESRVFTQLSDLEY